MKEKQKKCKHIFEHHTMIKNNLRGKACIWLFHRCKKCKLESEPSGLIEHIKKK